MRVVQLLRSMRGCRVPFRKHFWTGTTLLVCLAVAAGATFLVDRLLEAQRVPVWDGADAPPGMVSILALPGPEVGAAAPDFTLPRVDDGTDVRLKSLLGRKPLVLVFGSFSCDIFNSHLGELTRLHDSWKGRAEFLFVNVREAGHRLSNLEFLLPPSQKVPSLTAEELPFEEHRQAVRKALTMAKLPFPALIDRHDHVVMRDYGAFPLRLLIVDRGGKVALDMGRGVEKRWDLHVVNTWLQTHALAETSS